MTRQYFAREAEELSACVLFSLRNQKIRREKSRQGYIVFSCSGNIDAEETHPHLQLIGPTVYGREGVSWTLNVGGSGLLARMATLC